MKGSGDFSIGSNVWPGTSKLIEEMGELHQVLGKLIATHGDTEHWSGDLRVKLIEEIGDVFAALRFFGFMNLPIGDSHLVESRASDKQKLFIKWHVESGGPPACCQSCGFHRFRRYDLNDPFKYECENCGAHCEGRPNKNPDPAVGDEP